MEEVIKIDNLHKSFKTVKAVNGISFVVKKGEFFAFLGENGAGKSTTISIMCSQLDFDSGNVEICGENVALNSKEIASKIGVVFQNSALDKSISVYDNLRYRAGLYGITGEAFKNRLNKLVELFHFEDYINRQVSKLSGGQLRRIDIARALLHNPEILILDEPTTGLDPQTRKNLWQVIDALRKEQGLTVFLTTHYMEETTDSDYVVILDKGEIVARGTPIELKNKYAKDSIIIYNPGQKLDELGLNFTRGKDFVKIEIENTLQAKKLITAYPEIFVDYEITKGKMDDVFLAVTGKTLQGGEN